MVWGGAHFIIREALRLINLCCVFDKRQKLYDDLVVL